MRAYMIIFFATSWARSIIASFRRLGIFGPFLLESLDFSFLYLPLANELLLITLIDPNRSNLIWILYVIMAASGSLFGALLLDLLMRKAGEDGLKRFVNQKSLDKLKSKLGNNAGRAVFLSSLMPPPFPARVVVLTASALQTPRIKLLPAVFIGRLIRFTVEAILILYFGRKLLKYMESEVFEFVVYGLTIIALVGSFFSIRKWVGARK